MCEYTHRHWLWLRWSQIHKIMQVTLGCSYSNLLLKAGSAAGSEHMDAQQGVILQWLDKPQQFLCSILVLRPHQTTCGMCHQQMGASLPCRRDFPATITCYLWLLVIKVLYPWAYKGQRHYHRWGKPDNPIRETSPLTQLLPGLSQESISPRSQGPSRTSLKINQRKYSLDHLIDWGGHGL